MLRVPCIVTMASAMMSAEMARSTLMLDGVSNSGVIQRRDVNRMARDLGLHRLFPVGLDCADGRDEGPVDVKEDAVKGFPADRAHCSGLHVTANVENKQSLGDKYD